MWGPTRACICWACSGLAGLARLTSTSSAPSTRMLLFWLAWEMMEARIGSMRACGMHKMVSTLVQSWHRGSAVELQPRMEAK